VREHDGPRRRRGFDDDDPSYLKRHGPAARLAPESDDPDTGERWSTWDLSAAGEKGPRPWPDWLVTELAAVDTELGVLKTGKEADVFLVSRAVPDTDRACLLAAKRYRSAEHRMFHRDAGYLEGRRVRESRNNRAMARRTSFGRQVIAGQWAAAEFGALCSLWTLGVTLCGAALVPYPVQLLGTEVLLEFVGTPDGEAAPRLAETRPSPPELASLWADLVEALVVLARAGVAHGDLSAYNILVRDGRPVLIDLPQVVDIVANPRGPSFLARDVANVAKWFTARGLSSVDGDGLTELLLAEAGMR
jgi:RIO kinase 1